jgi:hypothetical protein
VQIETDVTSSRFSRTQVRTHTFSLFSTSTHENDDDNAHWLSQLDDDDYTTLETVVYDEDESVLVENDISFHPGKGSMKHEIVSTFAFVSAAHRGKLTEGFSSKNLVSGTTKSLSTLHGMQRVRLRVTPLFLEKDVSFDVDGYPGNGTRAPDSLNNTTVGEVSEAVVGRLPTSMRGNEPAIAVFLLNAVAILWGTQVNYKYLLAHSLTVLILSYPLFLTNCTHLLSACGY